ncbi:MAG: hypothetical protein ACRD8O_20980, partial [Bryobacteraceae bacterium]
FMNPIAFLKDPPPALAFEISGKGIAVASLGARSASEPLPAVQFRPLTPGTISVSPLRDNILMPDELAAAVKAAIPASDGRKRRTVAVILPDNCLRISVLDFDGFPSDAKEQLSLVRFRMKRSVPFDVDSAACSYWPQPSAHKKIEVVAAVAPVEIIARYEAPFRAAGLLPGFVTPSALAMLHLVRGRDLAVVAKLCGNVLTLMVVENNTLKLVRCIEVPHTTPADIAADLYPTFVYVEDQLGRKAGKLLLAGFGASTEDARRQFEAELGISVEAVRSLAGEPPEFQAGLIGYLEGLKEVA